MTIKKRSSLPNPSAVDETPIGLNIVAKPKLPMPKPDVTTSFADASPAQLRAIGNIALSCGDIPPDAKLTVGDRVVLLRTPFDKNNPQEQRYRNRVKNRATAITAMCIVCTGSRKLVTECSDTACPLWAFRLGSSPFSGKKK